MSVELFRTPWQVRSLSVAIHGGNAGTLYRHGDLLTVAGGNGDLVLSVATVDADGVVLTVTIVSP